MFSVLQPVVVVHISLGCLATTMTVVKSIYPSASDKTDVWLLENSTVMIVIQTDAQSIMRQTMCCLIALLVGISRIEVRLSERLCEMLIECGRKRIIVAVTYVKQHINKFNRSFTQF